MKPLAAAARCFTAPAASPRAWATSEHEVAADVYRALLLAGSEYVGSPPYVVSGPRSARAHTT